MERYCPLGIARVVPTKKISPNSKRLHESYFSQNIFLEGNRIFCDFSVGMELENEKIETRQHFCK